MNYIVADRDRQIAERDITIAVLSKDNAVLSKELADLKRRYGLNGSSTSTRTRKPKQG